ncbi:tripartite motif-containing protein 3-like [Branchiostoma lanceolatum]|uniref:tripartite motif-containing protein 3-like n=1 Tax=Branchiostoma lanceolatum TaxID=7740 RepID=UPI0034566007
MAKLSQFSVDFSEALSSTHPEVASLLVCKLCDRLYKQPRILSCLHTFCYKCLQYEVLKQGGEGQGTIGCPLCSQQTALPRGTSSLPDNHVITKIQEAEAIMSGNIHCTNCETAGAIAAARCNDCPEFLCAHCLSTHNFMKVFKSHKVVPVSELSQQDLTAFSQPLSCQTHKGKPLELFCNTCEVLICKRCTKDGHQEDTHEHSAIKEVWTGKLPALNTALKVGREHQDKMHVRAKSLNGELKLLEQKEEDVRGKVTDSFSKLKELVEKREDEVLEELERMVRERKSSMFQAHTEVMQGMKKLEGFCQFTDTLVSQASPAYGLTHYNLVAHQYQNLAATIPPSNHMQADLKLNWNQEEITAALAKITIVDAHKPTEMPTVPQHWWNGSNNLDVTNSTSKDDDRRHSWSGVVKAGLAPSTQASPTTLNNLSHHDTDSGASSGEDNVDSPAQVARGTRAYYDKVQKEKDKRPSAKSAEKPVFPHKVEALHKFGSPGSGAGQFLFPHSIAAGHNGLLYISDGQNHRIQAFDRKGKPQFTFGKKGKGRGMFIQPTYLAVSPDDHLFVRDKGSKRVQEFSNKGQFINQFFMDNLHGARGMTCDRRGRILIVDKGDDGYHQGVAFYSPSGALLKKVSCPNIPKMTVYANPVATNSKNEIFICDHVSHCLRVYNEHGRYVRQVGNEATIDVLMGVLVDPDDNIIVLNGITTVTGHNCIDELVRYRVDGALLDKITLSPSKQSINTLNLLEGRYPVGISNSKNWCLLYGRI